MEIQGDSFADIYSQLREQIMTYGEFVSPRGSETAEITNVNITLSNPRSRLAWHPDRRFSLPFAVAESIMLFHPSNKVGPVARINKRILQFSDDGETMNGSYGYRIAIHIDTILDRLKKDHSTRQAVLPIYAARDIDVNSKDIPCTLALHFLIRRGELQLHTYMRSNDLYWGVPYDFFQFTMLQEIVANELCLKLGSYHHHATSLHVYQYHFDLLHTIQEMEPVEFSTQYRLIDMQILGQILLSLEHTLPQLKNGPFTEILRHNEMKRRKLETKDVMIDTWAEKFLR